MGTRRLAAEFTRTALGLLVPLIAVVWVGICGLPTAEAEHIAGGVYTGGISFTVSADGSQVEGIQASFTNGSCTASIGPWSQPVPLIDHAFRLDVSTTLGYDVEIKGSFPEPGLATGTAHLILPSCNSGEQSWSATVPVPTPTATATPTATPTPAATGTPTPIAQETPLAPTPTAATGMLATVLPRTGNMPGEKGKKIIWLLVALSGVGAVALLAGGMLYAIEDATAAEHPARGG